MTTLFFKKIINRHHGGRLHLQSRPPPSDITQFRKNNFEGPFFTNSSKKGLLNTKKPKICYISINRIRTRRYIISALILY